MLAARLGAASGTSLGGLGIGSNALQDGSFFHHLSVVDIPAHGVLVASFTRVVSRSVWRVSFESFKRVKVCGASWGIGVPCFVDIKFGSHIPKLLVVLSILHSAHIESCLAGESRCLGSES